MDTLHTKAEIHHILGTAHSGKTSRMAGIAKMLNISGTKVLYITLEERADDLEERFHTGVDILETSERNATMLLLKVGRMIEEHGYNAVMIDGYDMLIRDIEDKFRISHMMLEFSMAHNVALYMSKQIARNFNDEASN